MGKRGPKRNQGKREANGRLSRSPVDIAKRSREAFDKQERDTMAVGTEARQRVFGVPAKDAKDQRSGDVVGRMRLGDLLTEQQYQAALNYWRDILNYRKAISAPKEPSAMDMGSVFGGSSINDEDWAVWVQKTKAKFEAVHKSIQDAQQEVRNTANLIGTLDVFLLRDSHQYQLEGDLRIALNALVQHYGLSRVRAA